MEFARPIFQGLLEDNTITTNFLKSDISGIEVHTLFAIFNSKELSNFKVRPIYSKLKGMDDD